MTAGCLAGEKLGNWVFFSGWMLIGGPMEKRASLRHVCKCLCVYLVCNVAETTLVVVALKQDSGVFL